MGRGRLGLANGTMWDQDMLTVKGTMLFSVNQSKIVSVGDLGSEIAGGAFGLEKQYVHDKEFKRFGTKYGICRRVSLLRWIDCVGLKESCVGWQTGKRLR
jgi:hypothetical protein